MVNITKKIAVGLVFVSILPMPIFAQTGNHFGEQKFLDYRIEYLGSSGTTVVDETGIHFLSQCCTIHESDILPVRYFGDYPLYFTGQTLKFRVFVKNEGSRVYNYLKIETFQEFFNAEGGLGEAMSTDNYNVWFINRLGSGEEIVLEGEFLIPLVEESGLDQTHLRISHWNAADYDESLEDQPGKGRVILEDFQAGIWCPVGIIK